MRGSERDATAAASHKKPGVPQTVTDSTEGIFSSMTVTGVAGNAEGSSSGRKPYIRLVLVMTIAASGNVWSAG